MLKFGMYSVKKIAWLDFNFTSKKREKNIMTDSESYVSSFNTIDNISSFKMGLSSHSDVILSLNKETISDLLSVSTKINIPRRRKKGRKHLPHNGLARLPRSDKKGTMLGGSRVVLTPLQQSFAADLNKRDSSQLLVERSQFFERLEMDAQMRLEREKESAILIQKIFRGYRVRPHSFNKEGRGRRQKISLVELLDQMFLELMINQEEKLQFPPIPTYTLDSISSYSYQTSSQTYLNTRYYATISLQTFGRMVLAKKEVNRRRFWEKWKLKIGG